MQNNYQDNIKAILAGGMIGIGGIAYLAIPNHIIGALFFSFGLITIIVKKYYLYTGMIGDYTFQDTFKYLMILLHNMFGACTIGAIAYLMGYDMNAIVLAKLSKSYVELFFSSVLCGVLMYVGVTSTKKANNPVYAMMAVAIFILTGAEHCIANAFYFSMAHVSVEIILFLLINILGNSIGAILWNRLENIQLEKALDNNN